MIIVAVVVIDQIIKIWVKTHFFYREEFMITDWFRLVFIENNGMAFGMEFGSKLILTWFRIIAVCGFIYYIVKNRCNTQVKLGFMACVAMITAGAIGTVIDCLFYGLIFDSPDFPYCATLFPEGGGYGTLFNGRVVDMFYFPLCEWDWPAWLPMFGGEHFIFFQPIFNFADASLSVGVIVLILFYGSSFSQAIESVKLSGKEEGKSDTEE